VTQIPAHPSPAINLPMAKKRKLGENMIDRYPRIVRTMVSWRMVFLPCASDHFQKKKPPINIPVANIDIVYPTHSPGIPKD
jgi:hypothetical protein